MQLPANTTRNTLLTIKGILEKFPRGEMHVWLDINGQRIDTKKYI